ncbi:hypothetical protein ACFVYF_31435 [Streptomyces sp. NPDC058274]
MQAEDHSFYLIGRGRLGEVTSLKRIVTVSLERTRIVDGLPLLEIVGD